MRGSYTNWDLIKDVFKHAKKPLAPKEIWDIAVKLGLDKKTQTKGKTPWRTLSSQLTRQSKESNSLYVNVDKKWKPKKMKK